MSSSASQIWKVWHRPQVFPVCGGGHGLIAALLLNSLCIGHRVAIERASQNWLLMRSDRYLALEDALGVVRIRGARLAFNVILL